MNGKVSCTVPVNQLDRTTSLPLAVALIGYSSVTLWLAWGGGIFVAHTAQGGMSRSLSDAIAMMLETGAVAP